MRSAICATRVDRGSAYLNISGDDQQLGFPGGRRVDADHRVNWKPIRAARRRRSTIADKQGLNARSASRAMLWPRQRADRRRRRAAKETAGRFLQQRSGPVFDSYFEATLTTASFTPRLISQHQSRRACRRKLLAGVDIYDSELRIDRSRACWAIRRSIATTCASARSALISRRRWRAPNTDLAVGGRLQRHNCLGARPARPDGARAASFASCRDCRSMKTRSNTPCISVSSIG